MTDEQSNQLDMLLVVNEFYTENNAVLDTIPVLQVEFPKIGLFISAININLAGQSANIKGVAQNKTNLRNNLNSLTFNILGIARAWAMATDNDELAEEFRVTESGLKKIKDDTMGAYCTHRFERVSANAAAMATYGITAVLLESWEDAIDAYTGKVSSPRQALNVRSTHTDNLKLIFDQSHNLLKDTIDPVMLVFKISNSTLYAAYQKARIIIDRRGPSNGTPPSALKGKITGTVKDKNTGDPIFKAKVYLLPTTKVEETDAEGKFIFKELPGGEYTIKVEHPGYMIFEQTFQLATDEQIEGTIELILAPPTPPTPPTP